MMLKLIAVPSVSSIGYVIFVFYMLICSCYISQQKKIIVQIVRERNKHYIVICHVNSLCDMTDMITKLMNKLSVNKLMENSLSKIINIYCYSCDVYYFIIWLSWSRECKKHVFKTQR